MANTRSKTKKESLDSKTASKISKPTINKKKIVKSNKVEKKINKDSKIQNEKIEKEEKEEQDFQLPSDSEDEDDDNNNNIDQVSDSESDTELQIHNDIIESSNDNKTVNTKVSNKSGHTIIKASNNNNNNNTNNNNDKNSKRGVIYIGRLPNGFEEKELRKYFQQFGEISRLRLSRNKKSGNSKHYAFIEFKELEVAKIAAETMNNYLLMGHLLKVSLLDNEKIHENLFIGANLKFRSIPYNKLNQIKHDKKKSKDEWKKLNDNHIKNVKSKQETLNAMGIDFDLTAL